MQLTPSNSPADTIDGIFRQVYDRTPGPVGVAVSGGSDSTALLVATVDWAARYDVAVHAATVNHGLRQEAAAEAAQVARLCETLGVSHKTLVLDGVSENGNLQQNARNGRYAALADWARDAGLSTVLIGHTSDDVAETFLQRLGRGAGVDGLAEMDWYWKAQGTSWVRPFLQLSRAKLRDYLRQKGIGWVDDPSNEDPQFDRVRVRKAMAVLSDLGIKAERVAESATHLRIARDALENQTLMAAKAVQQDDLGDFVISWPQYATLPAETSRRLAVALVQWIGMRPHPPRRDEQGHLVQQIWIRKPCTLSGCVITHDADQGIRFARERGDIGDHSTQTTQIWDGRWQLDGPHGGNLRVAALGDEGLKLCKTWRETGLQRRSLEASPAVWEEEELIAAPLAGLANGWCATLTRSREQFLSSLLSH